ncbi:unnamed protein product [Amoebophrya sp. A25]|nr:unnamed protein product [Amoebophrya sp. A25]|eukprot:GSA25T00023251001.1
MEEILDVSSLRQIEEMFESLTVSRGSVLKGMTLLMDRATSAIQIAKMMVSYGLEQHQGEGTNNRATGGQDRQASDNDNVGDQSLPLPSSSSSSWLARLYLISDVLQNSCSAQQPRAWFYRKELESSLPEFFHLGAAGKKSKSLKKDVMRVVDAWQEACLFSPMYLQGLRATFILADLLVLKGMNSEKETSTRVEQQQHQVQDDSLRPQLLDKFMESPRMIVRCREWERLEHYSQLEKLCRQRGVRHTFHEQQQQSAGGRNGKGGSAGFAENATTPSPEQVDLERRAFLIRQLALYEYYLCDGNGELVTTSLDENSGSHSTLDGAAQQNGRGAQQNAASPSSNFLVATTSSRGGGVITNGKGGRSTAPGRMGMAPGVGVAVPASGYAFNKGTGGSNPGSLIYDPAVDGQPLERSVRSKLERQVILKDLWLLYERLEKLNREDEYQMHKKKNQMRLVKEGRIAQMLNTRLDLVQGDGSAVLGGMAGLEDLDGQSPGTWHTVERVEEKPLRARQAALNQPAAKDKEDDDGDQGSRSSRSGRARDRSRARGRHIFNKKDHKREASSKERSRSRDREQQRHDSRKRRRSGGRDEHGLHGDHRRTKRRRNDQDCRRNRTRSASSRSSRSKERDRDLKKASRKHDSRRREQKERRREDSDRDRRDRDRSRGRDGDHAGDRTKKRSASSRERSRNTSSKGPNEADRGNRRRHEDPKAAKRRTKPSDSRASSGSSKADAEGEDLDGAPMEDIDGAQEGDSNDIDGEAMEEDIDGEPMPAV